MTMAMIRMIARAIGIPKIPYSFTQSPVDASPSPTKSNSFQLLVVVLASSRRSVSWGAT